MSKNQRSELKQKVAQMERMQQELGSKISGMSLNEAQAALAAAQKIVDDLKRQQMDALQSVQKATEDAALARKSAGMPNPAVGATLPVTTNSTVASTGNAPALAPNSAIPGVGFSATKRNTEDIMKEIQSVLQESKSAQAEMEAARLLCAEKVAESRTAISALEEARREQEKLGSKLNSSTVHMAQELKEAQSQHAMESEQLPTPPTPLPAAMPPLASILPSTTKLAPPGVTLSIEPSSLITCGGVLQVSFELNGGAWDADDAIHLCAVPAPGALSAYPSYASGRSRVSLYSPTEVGQNAYEALEYTSTPVLPSTERCAALKGMVRLSLPPWACHVQARYVRTTLTVHAPSDGASTVSREQFVLAHSAVINVTGGVHNASPIASPRNSTTRAAGSSRRGAGMLPQKGHTTTDIPAGMLMLLEHQKNIHAYTLSISLLMSNPAVVTRVMSWAVSTGTAMAPGTRVFTEFDVCHYVPPSVADNNAALEQCSEKVQLFMLATDVGLPVSSIEWNRTQVEVDADGRVSVRLPYVSGASSVPSTTTRVPTMDAVLDSEIQSTLDTNAGIECQFCGHLLVPAASIQEVNTLPSGVFDNIMHEFVCSEDISGMTLTTADLKTPVGCLMEGPIQLTVNPADIQAEALSVQCKTAPTMIDLFTGQGSDIASTPLPAATALTSPAVINMDTCVLHCARCLMYVGDGQLVSDNDCTCPVHDSTGGTKQQEPSSDMQLNLSDVKDVRLSRCCVVVPRGLSSTNVLNTEVLKMEQALARTVVHLMVALGVTSFVISVPPSILSRATGVGDALLLRLISREYAVALVASTERKSAERVESALECPAAIKVSFRYGSHSAIGATGKETRIPLPIDDFKGIASLLADRATAFGPSIFKEQKLGYLYL